MTAAARRDDSPTRRSVRERFVSFHSAARILVVVLVAGCSAATPSFTSTLAAPAVPSDPEHDVRYLASDLLEGRGAGSAGDDSAAVFIARGHAELGLAGAFPGACSSRPCAPSYFQYFSAPGVRGHNVGVVVPGVDSVLAREFVVVGAHYDHLGRSTVAALDPQLEMRIRPGADDNASGTAVVLELARRLAARPASRSVLLLHFDAEELGLLGSWAFVHQPPVPANAMIVMINLDMVGRLRNGPLVLDGSAADSMARARVDSVVRSLGLRARWSSATAGRSDHASFRDIHVPAVALFTGFHSDYHRVTDTADRIDLPGLLRVVDVAEALVRAAASPTWPARREPGR